MECLVAAAWLLAVAAHLGGWSESLSHDRLIGGEAGLLRTVGVYVVGWQLMAAAMMMPSMLPASRRFEAVAHDRPRRMALRLAFLGGYLARLTVFGVAMLIADLMLHDLVEAWPWLGARPWVIGGTALLLAGGFVLVGDSIGLPTVTERTSGISEDSLDQVRARRSGLATTPRLLAHGGLVLCSGYDQSGLDGSTNRGHDAGRITKTG